MDKKHQIIVIHGGDNFDTYQEYLDFLKDYEIDFNRYKSAYKGWKENLEGNLGQGYEVILPEMPNAFNAKYVEWELWFNKLVPFFADEVVLVGHSLGGTFLAKYLAENIMPKKIRAVFLISPAHDADDADYSMADFILPEHLDKISEQSNHILIYHSQDDPVVPFKDLSKFKKQLPKATIRIFTDRGHFNQEHLPELAVDIKVLF
jgi:predicted alpha/beta hydrolase family esterase